MSHSPHSFAFAVTSLDLVFLHMCLFLWVHSREKRENPAGGARADRRSRLLTNRDQTEFATGLLIGKKMYILPPLANMYEWAWLRGDVMMPKLTLHYITFRPLNNDLIIVYVIWIRVLSAHSGWASVMMYDNMIQEKSSSVATYSYRGVSVGMKCNVM